MNKPVILHSLIMGTRPAPNDSRAMKTATAVVFYQKREIGSVYGVGILWPDESRPFLVEVSKYYSANKLLKAFYSVSKIMEVSLGAVEYAALTIATTKAPLLEDWPKGLEWAFRYKYKSPSDLQSKVWGRRFPSPLKKKLVSELKAHTSKYILLKEWIWRFISFYL